MSSGYSIGQLYQGISKHGLNPLGKTTSGDLQSGSQSPRSKVQDKISFIIEKDISSVTQLSQNFSLGEEAGNATGQHLVIGGKNYLKLFTLDSEEKNVVGEIDLLDQQSSKGAGFKNTLNKKMNNINVVETLDDTIAYGLSNGHIAVCKLLNNGTCALLNKYTDHKRSINSMDFITNSAARSHPFQILSGSQDGVIKVWDIRVGNTKPALSLSSGSHSDPVRACKYSRPSSLRGRSCVLSVHDSGTLCRFDLRSGSNNIRQLINPEKKWTFHSGPALSLHIHPEREVVITGGRDQKICIWNYSDSYTNQNKLSPDYILSTYSPVMKVRWSNFPSQHSSNYKSALDTDARDFLKGELRHNGHDKDYPGGSKSEDIFKYDFACSFLNDDPTVNIYNLSRKYIPREVITHSGKKGFSSFSWSQNPNFSKKIWTITKSNCLTSYDLNSCNDDYEVSRPLEGLSTTNTAWGNSMGDLCLVNQDRNDFESTFFESELDSENEMKQSNVDSSYHSEGSETASETHSINEEVLIDEVIIKANKTNPDSQISESSNGSKSASPSAPGLSHIGSSSRPSFIYDQRPKQIFRGGNASPPLERNLSSTGKHPGIDSLIDSSPVNSSTRGSFQLSTRPSLRRNMSQSTQDSSASVLSGSASNIPRIRKSIPVKYVSPYIIPISIEISMNDKLAFETLSENYLISLPDGFSIVDACNFNAAVAKSVNKLRDAQTWRILATSMIDEYEEDLQITEASMSGTAARNIPRAEGTRPEDREDGVLYHSYENRSFSSELGNFVGSYNSNSTMNTNTNTEQDSKNEEADSQQKSSIKDHNSTNETNSKELRTPVSPVKENTFSSQGEKQLDIGNEASKKAQPKSKEDTNNKDAPDHTEQNSNIYKSSLSNRSEDNQIFRKDYPVDTFNQKLRKQNSFTAFDLSRRGSDLKDYALRVDEKGGDVRRRPISSYTKYFPLPERRSIDLDDENLNLISNAQGAIHSSVSSGVSSQLNEPPNRHNSIDGASYGSQRIGGIASSHGSVGIVRSLPEKRLSFGNIDTRNERQATLAFNKSDMLNINESDVITEQKESKSKLTEALGSNKKENLFLDKPWGKSKLLEKAIEYASFNGDIIMCSTLSLLFYEYMKEREISITINRERILEWVTLYIDILRSKCLFFTATKVINLAPKEILANLPASTLRDTNMRFFCCWCGSLLVNEKLKQSSINNLWYCAECYRQQSNCIYCNEPCKGLNVVTALKCGHRGHFGCIKEWFVVEGNVECPGCDEIIT
ncbi:Piso0_005772 [Millerozyma farinosa CBS 7064]|uniref:Restriction of telomere capping protein 1 n=1 Tax=Pichia sorbitophila (strain ATCC MYA-4447 / BCRC 22081 / CBS 7064 / NBRC 10061 / NRRL Y-12695) TaxID=559304 RepID=G8Y2W1_PICSO|nr:Piso0_005772 [Millerozyma farinosa CBS 7064]